MQRAARSTKLPSPGGNARAAPAPLDSKTEAPVTDGLVTRTRLFKILDATPARAVIWIAAPPGAGKSSLVASWIAARRYTANAQSIWYGMDEGDHDPIGFLAHLRRALADGLDIDVDILPRLTPEADAEIKPFATRWFKDLRAATRQPWVFAFDDMHRLSDQSATWQLITALIGALKASDRIAFLSRLAPPDFIKAAAPAKRFVEVTDLRVHVDEFDDFARARSNGEPLTRDSFRDRVRHTGGWISELAIGGSRHLSLQEFSGGGHASARTGGIGQFAPAERALLLRTAFLQVGTEAEWHTLGGTEAVALLQHLATDTGLASRRVNGGLRKHDLFHGHLMQAAAQSLPADALMAARAAAARVLAARQEYRAAIRLLIDAGAPAAARDLVLEQGPVLSHSGRNRELVDLVATLPEAMRDEPMIRIWDAHARLPFEPAAAQQTLHAVRIATDPQAQPAAYALAISGELQAALADWSEHRSLPALITEIDRHQAALADLPVALGGRIAIARAMALMFAWPTHPAILETRLQIEAMLPRLPAAQQLLLGGALINYLVWWRGDVRAARTFRDMLAPLARRADMLPLAVMLWYYGAISCACRDGDDDALQTLTNEAVTFAERWGVTNRLSNVFWLNVQAYADAGDRPTAEAMLQRFLACASGWRRTDFIGAHHLPALIALSAGDENTAIAEARTARGYAETYGGPQQIANQDMVLAMALAMKGDATAMTHVAQLRAVADQTHNGNFHLHADLAEIFLAQAQQRADDFRRLWPAMARAALELGQRRISGMNRTVLAQLAHLALVQGVDPDSTRRLIALWRLLPPADATVTTDWPYPVEIRTLGAFSVTVDGKRAAASQGKAQRKPLELLWHLLAAGDDGLAQEALADSLWPELEGDRAIHTLRTTIYRLRKLLTADAIRYADDRVAVDARVVRTDLARLRQAVTRLQDPAVPLVDRLAELDQALRLYEGPFLPGVTLPAVQAERARITAALAREARGLLSTQDRNDPAMTLREARLQACLEAGH
ncbi:MAG TPA: hypothetical protein VJR58_23880 [Vineibacter sp.]|nr:hypothetical protein [Vineibacter sp.]